MSLVVIVLAVAILAARKRKSSRYNRRPFGGVYFMLIYAQRREVKQK
jgi:hypothetical protein